jgi:streptogramin lyase
VKNEFYVKMGWPDELRPYNFFSRVGGVPQASAQIATGTVMVSTGSITAAGGVPGGSGKVSMFDPTGTFLGQLDTKTVTPNTTGSVFDSLGNFYVTDFQAQAVTRFDPTGSLIGSFGSGYNLDPESVIVDSNSNIYVGQADFVSPLLAPQVLKFNSNGASRGTFSPLPEDRGTDWIELGADQCTLYYTSEGHHVFRFNICTNTQLAEFTAAPLPGSIAYAHKLRLNGEMLVADSEYVVRLSATGAQIQQYSLGFPTLFALTLDPDGTSFWTGDLYSVS